MGFGANLKIQAESEAPPVLFGTYPAGEDWWTAICLRFRLRARLHLPLCEISGDAVKRRCHSTNYRCTGVFFAPGA